MQVNCYPHTPIVTMYSGSTVYGTRLPTSDTDIKFVFTPDIIGVLKEKQARNINLSTKKSSSSERNTEKDTDVEGFSVKEYLKLLSEGQTLAVDMFFTPKQFIVSESDMWKELVANKHRLISRKTTAFVGYCRAQASKYCVKSERLAAITDVCGFLSHQNKHDLLLTVKEQLLPLTLKHPGIVEFVTTDRGEFFSCCGRMALWTAAIDRAQSTYFTVYESYGNRSKAALDTGAKDWKALYHAVRVSKEAEELLLTGEIIFPRPEAELLLQIRKGEIPYQKVSDLLEEQTAAVEEALLKSTLPAEPDYSFIEDFVLEANLQSLKQSLCLRTGKLSHSQMQATLC